MKSRKALFAVLTEMKEKGICPGVILPKDHKSFSNETYGPKSCIYVSFQHMAEREKAEWELERLGFKVNRDYYRKSGNCSVERPITEIHVSYFRGARWQD